MAGRGEITDPSGQTTRVGERVARVRCTDPHTKLEEATGTVDFIDAMGTVFVKCADGSRSGLVAEAGDRWVVIAPGRI